MKRSILLTTAAVIALAAGCSKQPAPTPPAPDFMNDCLIDPWTAIDASPYLLPAPAGYSSVTAVNGGSRTYLEPNGNSRVSVKWSAGNSFKMYTRDSSGSMYHCTYTTSDSGSQAVFVGKGDLTYLGTTAFHSIYPGATKTGYSNGDYLFGVNAPAEQTAIPGGVEEDLNYSYAYSESTSSDLHFSNVFSLLRFSLSGEKAATLQSIEFMSSDQIAGDFLMIPTDGIPYITQRHFTGDNSSSTITLNGPFLSGKEYYVVLAPGVRQLKLTFRDSGGDSRAVLASNSLTFTRGHVTDISDIALGPDFYTSGQEEPGASAELYMEASSGYKPVSIVVVPDGYTQDQLDDYKMRAYSAINALFDVEPYKSYKEYFNVWVLSVASNESGASVTDGKGNITEYHDCYFGSRWGADSYSDMKLNEDVLNSFVESACPDILNGVRDRKEVPILVLINDDRYGGMCHWGSNSHRYCMVPYVFNGKRIRFSQMEYVAVSDSDPSAGSRDITEEDIAQIGVSRGDWRNMVVHEFGGHCIGRLSDEYWLDNVPKSAVSTISSHNSTIPYALNISATYSPTPWDEDLMSRRDQLITVNPLYARIGSFQGGALSVLNRWRSEFISCMDDNRLYFSTWQRDLIVRHIFDLAGDTFNLSDFFAKDVIFDPIRDGGSSATRDMYRPGEPEYDGPRLLPPVYSED